MASSAIRPELSAMLVVSFMAGIAVTWGSLVYIVDMATRTGNIGMLPGKFKGGKVVIEACWQPSCGGVAAAAVRAELTLMRITRFVAGIAVSGSAFEDVIGMTAHAGSRGVCSG
jgi:hypothetical protein